MESGFLATNTCSLLAGTVASLLHFDCTGEEDYKVIKWIEKEIKMTHILYSTFQIQI
jgi:hypothetical protein